MFSFSLLLCVVLCALCLSSNMMVFAEEEAAETMRTSSLLESVLHGDVAGIESALAGGEDVDVVNTNGWSGAMFAVMTGNIEVLEVLIEHDIDLNNADNDGITPLMRAALAVSFKNMQRFYCTVLPALSYQFNFLL